MNGSSNGSNQRGSSQAISKAQARQMIRSAIATTVERKFCDDDYAQGVDYNGSVQYLLRTLGRGDTSTTCTGNLIRVRRIELRGIVSTNQSHSSMRMVLFAFKDSTAPAASGVFESTGNVNAPYSPISIVNKHKIKILCDRSITLFPVAGSYAAQKFEMICDVDVQVQLPASLTASYAQFNGIFLAFVSDDIIPSYPSLYWKSRVEFEDA